MREIPLTRGHVALVDDEDYARVAAHHWHVVCQGSQLVARRGAKKGEATLLHRFVMDVTGTTTIVVPKDGNMLDCRRGNLELITRSQAARRLTRGTALTKPVPALKPTVRGVQRSPHVGRGATGYRGVSLDKRSGRYTASMMHDRRYLWLGIHDTAESAARAYDDKAWELHGDQAILNFPQGDESLMTADEQGGMSTTIYADLMSALVGP